MTICADPSLPPFRITIVGAGLAGCLSALLLSPLRRRRRVKITLLEYRADPRTSTAPAGRSINLALSTRGLSALAEADLDSAVRGLGTKMSGRYIHSVSGDASVQPYGLPGQHLLSVSRAELNALLLDAVDAVDNASIIFSAKCTRLDLETGRVTYAATASGDEEAHHLESDLIIGADGTYSRVRAALERHVPRFDTSRAHIPAAYKELCITRAAAEACAMPREYLHVWPRHDFMLIALPNGNGSFTATLFMDAVQLDELEARGRTGVAHFFQTFFPDALPLMPDIVDQFLRSPTPSLLTVRCEPYHFRGRAVVIGDAAHAIVPFFGQGCNAAFEDCVRLRDAIAQHALADMDVALEDYSVNRKPDADAIADLAVDHYKDMASKSVSPLFALRKRAGILAHRIMPDAFMPLYSMVTFSNIPYATAVERAAKQERIISNALSVGAGICAVACVGTTWYLVKGIKR